MFFYKCNLLPYNKHMVDASDRLAKVDTYCVKYIRTFSDKKNPLYFFIKCTFFF